MSRVHLIEPVGRGGIYQHTVQLAAELSDVGHTVVVHTASDAELMPQGPVTFCTCFSWCHAIPNRHLRLAALTIRFLVATLPHWIVRTRGTFVHVQGQFAQGLYLPSVAVLARTAKICIFSPHNTFARSGSRRDAVILSSAVKRANRCVYFSRMDEGPLRALGAKSLQLAPLVQFAPSPDPDLIASWRSRLAPSGAPLVVLAGQIRSDKGVDHFLRAATVVSADTAEFAVVGEDKGHADEARKLRAAIRAPVKIVVDYLDIVSFAALLCAADLVVAPYRQASSSGVIALAAQLGTPAVAYPVGGLTTSGAQLTSTCTPQALADSIIGALSQPREAVTQRLGQDWIGALYGPV